VDRLGHGNAVCQFFANPSGALRLLLIFWRDPGLRFEQAMKMIGADANCFRQLIERHYFSRLFQQPAGFFHPLCMKLCQ